jgi:hypothetical protein
VHLQLTRRLGFQFADGRRDVSGEDGRVRPLRVGERGRCHVLGSRVQRHPDRTVGACLDRADERLEIVGCEVLSANNPALRAPLAKPPGPVLVPLDRARAEVLRPARSRNCSRRSTIVSSPACVVLGRAISPLPCMGTQPKTCAVAWPGTLVRSRFAPMTEVGKTCEVTGDLSGFPDPFRLRPEAPRRREAQVRDNISGGGGRESNPPTVSRRRTGFEDREGHQSPFASHRMVGAARDRAEPAVGARVLGGPDCKPSLPGPAERTPADTESFRPPDLPLPQPKPLAHGDLPGNPASRIGREPPASLSFAVTESTLVRLQVAVRNLLLGPLAGFRIAAPGGQ